MQLVISTLIGLAAGVLSGLFGIGGGIIVVPALIFLVGLNQHTATGTSLAALLLPVGIIGVLTYYRSHAVNLPVAGMLALGIVIGTALGARVGLSLPEVTLRRLLAGLMMAVAVQLLLKR
jgi:uncharacterized protein